MDVTFHFTLGPVGGLEAAEQISSAAVRQDRIYLEMFSAWGGGGQGGGLGWNL